MGLVLPGALIQLGTLMLAARADEPPGGAPIAALPTGPSAVSQSSQSAHGNVLGGGSLAGARDGDGSILRCARADPGRGGWTPTHRSPRISGWSTGW